MVKKDMINKEMTENIVLDSIMVKFSLSLSNFVDFVMSEHPEGKKGKKYRQNNFSVSFKND